MATPAAQSNNTQEETDFQKSGRRVETAGNIVRTTGQVAQTTGRSVELAGKGTQAAGKGVEVAGKGVQVAGKGVQAAGKGVAAAGKAMMAIPVVGTALGGITAGAGTAVQGAGKGVEVAGKGVEGAGKGINATGKGVSSAGKGIQAAGKSAKFYGNYAQKSGQGMQSLNSLAARKSQFAQSKISPSAGLKANSISPNSKSPNLDFLPALPSDAARRSMLQSNMLRARQNPMRPPTPSNVRQEEDEGEQEEEQQGEKTKNNFRSFMQMEGIISQNLGIKATEESAEEKAKKEAERAALKAAKAMAPKGISFATSIISDAIGVGTGGVGYLVTIFPKLAVLGIWNVQMIYGSWLRKGKDEFVPPLTWDPIKIPIDKNSLLFQAAVIMMDLMVFALGIAMMGLIATVIYLLFNPCEAVKFFGAGWVAGLACKAI